MVSLKQKISGYKHDFVRKKNKIRENLKKSEEFASFKSLIGEVILFSVLGGLTFLAFTSSNILIKFIGIGSGLVLFKDQALGWIKEILSSFVPVKVSK